jgi:seryl-tRNA synthetase
VPEVLQKYMPEKYKTEIPFVKPAPIEVEAALKKGKKK